jgi:predicted ATPase with chaperone activity
MTSGAWSIELDIARLFDQAPDGDLDFEDVKGPESVNCALEIAAAGSHNGPPGTRSSILAERLIANAHAGGLLTLPPVVGP